MSALDAILGPGFHAAFREATSLPCECSLCGELFTDGEGDECADCIAHFDNVAMEDRPPSDRIAWCDPIPDMEAVR